MMSRSAAILAAILAVVAAGLLTGCGLSRRIAPDTVSLADRCSEIMKAAMPFADIDIGNRSSQSTDIRTIVVHVEGTRTDKAGNDQVGHDLAAECTFEDGVLTGFHWTKGGPSAH
jgi:hypothetical protein